MGAKNDTYGGNGLMKATINGTQVEGTPEEIVKYQKLVNNLMINSKEDIIGDLASSSSDRIIYSTSPLGSGELR